MEGRRREKWYWKMRTGLLPVKKHGGGERTALGKSDASIEWAFILNDILDEVEGGLQLCGRSLGVVAVKWAGKYGLDSCYDC